MVEMMERGSMGLFSAKLNICDDIVILLKTYGSDKRERHPYRSVVQDQLKKDQRSVGWLARQISCTRNNLYKVFKKPSLDAELLLRISKAMHFNFFQYYTASFLQAMKERVGEE